MMKKIKFIKQAIMVAAVLLPTALFAQQASMSVEGLSGQNITIAGGTLYVPAGGYINATGNIYVGVNSIVTGALNTTVTGNTTGRLNLLSANQLDATVPAAPTLIDANAVLFDVNTTLYNPLNLTLTDQAFGGVTTDESANIFTNKEFAFGIVNPFTGAAITDNHVILNANRFTVTAAGTLTGYDLNRYVVTNDNSSELRKISVVPGQSFFFPIGRAEADYTPANVQLTSSTATDYYMNVRNFAESVPDETIGGYDMMGNVSRTWLLYSNSSTSVANIDFIHPGTPAYEVNGYDRTNSNVIRFAGNSWIPNTPNDAENEGLFGTGTNYWAQQLTYPVTNVIGANTFFGKSNSLVVLPVKIASFTAKANVCEAIIDWTTSLEQNVRFFNVERSYSAMAGSWTSIATVNARGNSNTLNRYSVTDSKAMNGVAYYRLAIVDVDGSITYGPVSQVTLNCNEGSIVIYPNPVQEFVKVKLPLSSGKYSVRILNVAGQIVSPILQGATGTVTLNTARLSSGTYIVQVTDENGKIISSKIVKN